MSIFGFLIIMGMFFFYYYYPLDYDKNEQPITAGYLNYQCSNMGSLEKTILGQEGYRICSEAKMYEMMFYLFEVVGIIFMIAGLVLKPEIIKKKPKKKK